MTKCTSKKFKFPSIKKLQIEAGFTGGAISSDGGILLLRQVEQRIKLLERVAQVIPDNREQSKITHSLEAMLKQRVFGIALGYEDLNDHNTLRNDVAFQTAANTEKQLASSPTLCRMEKKATKKIAVDIHKIMIDHFIESFDAPPKELILDFDATDDIVHGEQVGRHYHGYYGNYCFLPLYVFCGDKLLVSYLRPSDKDAAKHAWAILALLVKTLRSVWPNVKIVFRGDSGFCRHSMLTWCERKDVGYIVGTAGNKRLESLLKPAMEQAERQFEQTKEKQRIFTEFMYAAGSWPNEKKIIGKAEHTAGGANPRYIVTNLEGDPQDLYDNVYCARGEMENRIKEQQLYLFADRTSCHEWWPNQFRMLLASLAYVLLEYLRSTALKGTILENAQVNTMRLKLFKIGTAIVKNTRRIIFMFSSHYPYQDVFERIYDALVSQVKAPT